MSDKARKKGAQILKYYLKQQKKNVTFDIIDDISEYVTLVQLKDSRGSVNHSVSVVGDWIIEYNFEKGLILNQASLDLTFSCTHNEDSVLEFEQVFYDVKFINPKEKNNKTKSLFILSIIIIKGKYHC